MRPPEWISALRKPKAEIMMVSDNTAGVVSQQDMAVVMERLSALEQCNQELEQQLKTRACAE